MTLEFPRWRVLSASLAEIVSLAHLFYGSARCVVHELAKKLNVGYPLKENMVTPLAEG